MKTKTICLEMTFLMETCDKKCTYLKECIVSLIGCTEKEILYFYMWKDLNPIYTMQ